MKIIILFLVSITLCHSALNAQTNGNKKVNSFYGNWSFGVGVNAVNDSGTQEKGIFNISEYWNISHPLTISAEYFFNNQFSVSAMGSLNKYVEGKIIDNTSYVLKNYEPDYLAVDVAARLYFGDLFSNYEFDPYTFLGVGYTNISSYKAIPFENLPVSEEIDQIPIDENGNFDIPTIGRITLNGGAGFNYWFANSWGFNMNAAFKWGIASGEYKRGANIVSNHIQFSMGVIYFLSDIGTRQFGR